MLFSKLFIPTLRDAPADAEAVSHVLMLRAGYVRQLAAGLYIYLPLGWRVMRKINAILKEEMDAIGAQEISMPVLHPAEVWRQTGRWDAIGDEMFRLKDRSGRDMCLGMTHEEIMTWLASREIRSYRDLPQAWYQIQTKLRDEARPKSGILRTREFIMKDSYSFDASDEGLHRSYELHAEAYHRIFKRCDLRFLQVESDTGMMGGAGAHEFMAQSPAGEDEVAVCGSCGYDCVFSSFPEGDGCSGGQCTCHGGMGCFGSFSSACCENASGCVLDAGPDDLDVEDRVVCAGIDLGAYEDDPTCCDVSDCTSGQKCCNGVCTSAAGGQTCCAHGDCAADQVCCGSPQTCVTGTCCSDSDCGQPTPRCRTQTHQCVRCLTNADCGVQACNQTTFTCESGGAQE